MQDLAPIGILEHWNNGMMGLDEKRRETNIPSFQHSISPIHLSCLPGASKKFHFGLDSLFDRLPARAQNLSRVELFGFVCQNLSNGTDKAKSQVSINVDFGNT